MAVFKHYAQYYNLLYKDKDYQAEVSYILSLIRQYKPDAKTILDLGCGTGHHACLLAEQGFEIVGVDFSESMISLAQLRKKQLSSDIAVRTCFQQSDIRHVDLNRQFDVIVSLFHVFSYLTTNEDLKQGFQTVYKHLKSEGLFLFDFWYGPAVLKQQPEVRTKHLSDETIDVERCARPEINYNENYVDVNYDLSICEKATASTQKIQEQHRMRYLFLPEMRQFLRDARMKPIFAEEWMTKHQPGPDTWGVCCGASKNSL